MWPKNTFNMAYIYIRIRNVLLHTLVWGQCFEKYIASDQCIFQNIANPYIYTPYWRFFRSHFLKFPLFFQNVTSKHLQYGVYIYTVWGRFWRKGSPGAPFSRKWRPGAPPFQNIPQSVYIYTPYWRYFEVPFRKNSGCFRKCDLKPPSTSYAGQNIANTTGFIKVFQ